MNLLIPAIAIGVFLFSNQMAKKKKKKLEEKVASNDNVIEFRPGILTTTVWSGGQSETSTRPSNPIVT